MVADFSALDAELDQLGAGPAVDAAALASSYAGTTDRLSDIDAALSALAVDVRVDAAVALAQPYVANVPSSLPPPPTTRPAERLDSDEIALPNAMPRVGNDESGELPLDGVTPQSGSFALPYEEALPSADVAFAEDLTFEADVDELIEMPAAPLSPALFERRDRESEPDHAAEADFAALFPEVSIEPGPEVSYDDTEIFDSSALEFDAGKPKPKLEPIENAFTEELDSAEFEIVMESTESGTQATPSTVPPHPSQPPEKRPSFLGRLFGRKEE